MQFTIDNNNHILVRGVAIKLEDNKNTLFISQDPTEVGARLYFVDNSRIGYHLQLVGPQDLSNYVKNDLIKLSSRTSLIKTNSLYIKDSSYEGNKVVTKSDIAFYRHHLKISYLSTRVYVDVYSRSNMVVNTTDKLTTLTGGVSLSNPVNGSQIEFIAQTNSWYVNDSSGPHTITEIKDTIQTL